MEGANVPAAFQELGQGFKPILLGGNQDHIHAGGLGRDFQIFIVGDTGVDDGHILFGHGCGIGLEGGLNRPGHLGEQGHGFCGHGPQ